MTTETKHKFKCYRCRAMTTWYRVRDKNIQWICKTCLDTPEDDHYTEL